MDASVVVEDAGMRIDAGSPTDGGIEKDAGQPIDAGSILDAGPESDAGNGLVDAGAASDAGVPVDAGSVGGDGGPPADAGQGDGGLGIYNVAPSTVTVAGISSGGYMAVQLQVAYSASFFGAAIIAGGTYYCGQDDEALWATACETGVDVPVADLVSFTKSQADAGTIDPVSNIGGKPIYMFSGTLDTVDYQATMDELKQYYGSFTTSSEITYNNTTAAEHSWVTPDAADNCSYLGSPFMNNCGSDVESDFLTLFYGTLAARNSTPHGSYIQFDQNAFCAGSDCAAIGMDSTAWVYVPASCAAHDSCKLVVALHGCEQNQQSISTTFVKNAGVNEWADNNGVVVLYPQTIASVVPENPEGCWDWWGYTGSDYAVKSAPQMSAIMAMVRQIAGG